MPPDITFFSSQDFTRCWPPDFTAARSHHFFAWSTQHVIGRPLRMSPDIMFFGLQDSSFCWPPDTVAARYHLYFNFNIRYNVSRIISLPPDIIISYFARCTSCFLACETHHNVGHPIPLPHDIIVFLACKNQQNIGRPTLLPPDITFFFLSFALVAMLAVRYGCRPISYFWHANLFTLLAVQ